MEKLIRPNRSDEHVSVAEEMKQEEETREYFLNSAPESHRPYPKPNRSDDQSAATNLIHLDHQSHINRPDRNNFIPPENNKLQNLELHDTLRLNFVGEDLEAVEEYRETDYYEDMNRMDKQHHHTTGSGFIKMDQKTTKNIYELGVDVDRADAANSSVVGSNPATNEWIPEMEPVFQASNKPKRSDN